MGFFWHELVLFIQSMRRAVESDLLNVSLIAKLRQLEHPWIYCSGLSNEYQDIQTVEVIAPDVEPQEADLNRRHQRGPGGGGPNREYHHRPRHDGLRYARGARSNRGLYNRVPYPYWSYLYQN